MIDPSVLWSIRNELPMPFVVKKMANDGPVSKMIEGYFRFECPYCHEMRATVNPKNNLAHCFCCHKNTNTIDLMLSVGFEFKEAIRILKGWMREYRLEGELVEPVLSKVR